MDNEVERQKYDRRPGSRNSNAEFTEGRRHLLRGIESEGDLRVLKKTSASSHSHSTKSSNNSPVPRNNAHRSMNDLDRHIRSSLSHNMAQQREQQLLSNGAFMGSSGQYQDSSGHPCPESMRGIVTSNALSHSGPPALVRPTSISRFEKTHNPENMISSRNQHIDDTSSVISFTSSVHSLDSAGFNQRLGRGGISDGVTNTRTEDVRSNSDRAYPLSSLSAGGDLDKLSRDLLAMSSSPANYMRMRTVPVISTMVQLLHQYKHDSSCDSSKSLGDNLSNRQSRDVRSRVARALHNTVHNHPSHKHCKKEEKVLRLLEDLRMYADVLRDLTSSLKEAEKKKDEPSEPNEEGDEKDSETSLPIREKERMISLLGNCNSIKVATVRNLNSPTGKDLIILCGNLDIETNTGDNINLGHLLFKFPCRNFVNYQTEFSMGIQASGSDDDNMDVDSGIISMEDYASYGDTVNEEYREILIAKFQNLSNFWISLNIEKTMQWLTKWSFDEGHRQPIELLGGIPALAEFVQIEMEAHRSMCHYLKPESSARQELRYQKLGCDLSSKSCIEVRRFAVVALTNMTFGKANIKSFLSTFPGFIHLMVCQLQHQENLGSEPSCRFHSVARNTTSSSSIENLKKATAHLFRNLAWKADKNSKQILSESEVVAVLLRSAIDVTMAALSVVERRQVSIHDILPSCETLPKEVEPFLKVILSALWNLSAHCKKNKYDICEMDGGLQFLEFLLRQSKSAPIVESSGGILRNISSFIATSPSSEKYRQTLRLSGCLDTLLQQLKSSSLTIVSNACGTLWNFSARNIEDQALLWKLGAVPMLESLTNSKHKTISTCSLAALKNLYGFKERESNVRKIDGGFESSADMEKNDEISSMHSSHSQNTLEKRKRKNKAKELDEKLQLTHQPQVQDEDKDSCTSGESDASDSESWNIENRNYQIDATSRDDGSQGDLSSRLSNISGSKRSFSASNDLRSGSRASNKGNDEPRHLHGDQSHDSRTYNTGSNTFGYAQGEQFGQDGLNSPSFTAPLNSSHSRMSPALQNTSLNQRQFDGRFTNYMKQYQPSTQLDASVTTASMMPSQSRQNSFTAHAQPPTSSSFNDLLSPSKLPHLSFNATTSSPLYLTQNNSSRQNESLGNRLVLEESGDECIDECPTDYSLRFQENEESELQGLSRSMLSRERGCTKEEEGNASLENDDDDQERIKTYCIEGTPCDTPFVISHAGSVTDLRDDNPMSSEEEDEQTSKMKSVTNGMANNILPMMNVNSYRPCNLQDDDDLEDESESNGPKIFCTEDTPGVFSRADSISSLSSDGDDLIPTESQRQQVIEMGQRIPAPGEFISSNMHNLHDVNLEPEKGELETNSCTEKEKKVDVIDHASCQRETLTPPIVSSNRDIQDSSARDENSQPTNTNSQNTSDYHTQMHQMHHNKHVKFNPIETPLMYSRASSPESLASCDIDGGYKDVYSSYEQSRATSGRVSPSDLPDSPCQSRPRSPPPKPLLSNKKPQLTMRVLPSCNSISNSNFSMKDTSTTRLLSRKENELSKEKAAVKEDNKRNAPNKVSHHAMHDRNQEQECEEEEEEEVKCFADEGETPACFSPLSRLTFSDEEKEGQKQREFTNHNSKVILSNYSHSHKMVFIHVIITRGLLQSSFYFELTFRDN